MATRDDVANKVAETYPHLTKGLAKDFTKTTFEVMSEMLKAGEVVNIHQFGQFKVIKTKPRNGVNPATGKKLTIPSHMKPTFKASKTLKDSVQ